MHGGVELKEHDVAHVAVYVPEREHAHAALRARGWIPWEPEAEA